MPEVRSESTGPAGGAPAGADRARSARELKQQGAEIADAVKEQGKGMLSRQKDAAAEQVESVAQALLRGAREMQQGEQGDVGRVADAAAGRLESLGRELREKDLDSLIADAEDIGRRSPGAFFAGSVVAGFLLSRFLKSSAERRAHRGDGEARVTRSAPFGEPVREREFSAGSPVHAPAAPQAASAGDPTTAPTAQRAALLGGVPTPNTTTSGGPHGAR